MKPVTFLNTVIALTLLAMISACQPSKKEDAVEVAEETNDSTFDSRDEEKDADFVVNAVASSYAEIKLAQLAKNKSGNGEIKQLATMLENDHNKIVTELKAYAGENAISVPSEESEDAKKDLVDLSEIDGGDFDKKWCKKLEDNHQKTINKFESRIDKTEDPALKNWISATLPNLKTHLEMIQEHENKVN